MYLAIYSYIPSNCFTVNMASLIEMTYIIIYKIEHDQAHTKIATGAGWFDHVSLVSGRKKWSYAQGKVHFSSCTVIIVFGLLCLKILQGK